MICHDCGGSDIQGTCVCGYDYPPEPDMSCPALTDPYGDLNPHILPSTFEGLYTPPYAALKQICHFCGVDLFLQRTDLNIRMCVPCGLSLNNRDTVKCIVCDKTYLDDYDYSVCESCRSL